MSKRTQEDAGEKRVTAKSKPMMNLVSRYSVRDPERACLDCIGKSGWKPRSESQNAPLSSLNVQHFKNGRDLLRTLAHQTPQNGMQWRQLGLLKCGNLVNCSKWERWDLEMNNHQVGSHSTLVIDLLFVTMKWTLTPSTESDLSLKITDHSCIEWVIECERCWTNL